MADRQLVAIVHAVAINVYNVIERHEQLSRKSIFCRGRDVTQQISDDFHDCHSQPSIILLPILYCVSVAMRACSRTIRIGPTSVRDKLAFRRVPERDRRSVVTCLY